MLASAMKTLRLVVMLLGALAVLAALAALGFAVLAGLGMLADVSAAENRAMGRELLAVGVPLLVGGLLVFVLAWRLGRRAA